MSQTKTFSRKTPPSLKQRIFSSVGVSATDLLSSPYTATARPTLIVPSFAWSRVSFSAFRRHPSSSSLDGHLPHVRPQQRPVTKIHPSFASLRVRGEERRTFFDPLSASRSAQSLISRLSIDHYAALINSLRVRGPTEELHFFMHPRCTMPRVAGSNNALTFDAETTSERPTPATIFTCGPLNCIDG